MARERYAVSGAIATILDSTVDATGGTGAPGDPTALLGGIALLGQNLPSGKALWLRSVWAYAASAAALLHVFDGSAGTNATDASRRFLLPCASGETTQADIPAPGLKFTKGAVVCKDTTGASGSFTPGSVGGAGYYE